MAANVPNSKSKAIEVHYGKVHQVMPVLKDGTNG